MYSAEMTADGTKAGFERYSYNKIFVRHIFMEWFIFYA